MKKINTNELAEETWTSPMGKFVGASKSVSEALGRKPQSTDLNERHPFDVEVLRIPPGKTPYPFHSHSAQWEFYHVISGTGRVRHGKGTESIKAGDAFLFKPGEAHQLINDSAADLLIYVIADNPIGESCHYPDSGKWLVRSPERRVMRGGEQVPYYHGEERMKVLFLCTGNSCRSQMAEGWARHLRNDLMEVHSAGVDKHPVNPHAIKVMAEAGVDISKHRSKTPEELGIFDFDYVITLCGNADKNCPGFSGNTKVVHMAFFDPPRLTRHLPDGEEKLAVFRRVRDQIREFIEALPDALHHPPTPAGK